MLANTQFKHIALQLLGLAVLTTSLLNSVRATMTMNELVGQSSVQSQAQPDVQVLARLMLDQLRLPQQQEQPINRKLAAEHQEEPEGQIFLVIKKRPVEAEGVAGLKDLLIETSNSISDWNGANNKAGPQQAGHQQGKTSPVGSSEHTRRILDDKFGIMKESMFTTNNQLGLKGVPKFGSDEVL